MSMKHHFKSAFLGMLFCLTLVVPTALVAQETAVPAVRPQPGEDCQRRTDRVAGVVKQDACGRLYCGRKDFKDVAEALPGIEARLQCSWKVVGRRCLCVKE
jgi:hypothetical protein